MLPDKFQNKYRIGTKRASWHDYNGGAISTDDTSLIINKKSLHAKASFLLSGWPDSNWRPPAPKAGALTGLRYTPKKRVQR